MSRKWNPRRRRFLGLVVTAAAAAPGAACSRQKRFGRCFTVEEARTAEAICECLIPSDEFPGAAWAGAVKFLDRQLAGHLSKHAVAYRRGLAAIDEASAAKYGLAFAKIGAGQQSETLKAVEKGEAAAPGWKPEDQREFFELILAHTMQSYYGDPRHGGNRDGVGYRMIGLTLTPVRGRQPQDLTAICGAGGGS